MPEAAAGGAAPYYRSPSGDVVLWRGDCEVVLPTLPAESVDLVFTSPPYNLGNTTGGGFPDRFGHYRKSSGLAGRGGGRTSKWAYGLYGEGGLAHGYGEHDDNMPHEEYVAWQGRVLLACWRLLSERGAIFYVHKPRILDGRFIGPIDYVPAALRPYVRQEIIWKRSGGINFTAAFYLPMHERIVVIARRDWRLRRKGAAGVGDVWTVHQAVDNPHPAPFPIGLPARAIETCAPATVLDPFCGSGTSIRAAKNAGVRSIGVEREERWCRHTVERLAQSVLPGLAAG
jgi:site-specific DNA-methyltransferase (adenine-specific)